MVDKRKQEDESQVEKEEGPKGDRGRREERTQILDIPSRDTQWKEGLKPEFMLCLVTLKKKSCCCLLV